MKFLGQIHILIFKSYGVFKIITLLSSLLFWTGPAMKPIDAIRDKVTMLLHCLMNLFVLRLFKSMQCRNVAIANK